MLVLERAGKSYDHGRTWAARDVSFCVDRGETVVLLGSSGSGKTTTLKLINRLIEPTEGSITLDGRDVTGVPRLALRRSIGYVFQNIGLFPHMTIRGNVAIVPRLLGWSRRRRMARAEALLDLVGLSPAEFGSRLPRQLSGGQQQRVGIARALAADPAFLLMDEPFGALDAVTRDGLQGEVARLSSELGKAIVFVTHDVFEACRLGTRIGVMHAGRVEQIGTPDEIQADPATPFVRDLFGRATEQARSYAEGGA